MSKHNYSQYSNKKNEHNKPRVEATEVPVIDISDMLVTEDTDVSATPIEVKMEPKTKPIKGVVANCAKLNIREKPVIDADVVCVLDCGSEMEIDMSKSTINWFKVCTIVGVEGYCMRKFVNVNL